MTDHWRRLYAALIGLGGLSVLYFVVKWACMAAIMELAFMKMK